VKCTWKHCDIVRFCNVLIPQLEEGSLVVPFI